MTTVYANSRSIVHKGDGKTNIAAPPDVCKTPSPGGPVPIPYVNVAQNSNLASGSKKTKIEGNAIGLKSSNVSTSSGDEPGTAGGGIVSSKFKGKMTWIASSTDVKVEGKGVVRFMDPTMHNGNTGNVPNVEAGGPNIGYGKDFTGDCAVCSKPQADHPELVSSKQRPTAEHVAALLKALEDDKATDHFLEVKSLTDAIAQLNKDVREQDRQMRAAIEERTKWNEMKIPGQADENIDSKATDAHERAQNFRTARDRTKERKEQMRCRLDELKGSLTVVAGAKPFYMIGVMMCETHVPTVFSSMSGGENMPGFDRVSRQIGFVPVNTSGGVTKADYVRKNSHLADAAKMNNFNKRWDKANEDCLKRENDSPDPGICAAQHLCAHEGHLPRALTEAWFDPDKKKSPMHVQHIRDATNFADGLRQELNIDWTAVPAKPYVHKDVVPSCRTCQALLPFILCEDRNVCS